MVRVPNFSAVPALPGAGNFVQLNSEFKPFLCRASGFIACFQHASTRRSRVPKNFLHPLESTRRQN
ncbi:hypothetical protein MPLA_1320010 [Mesorhizobium sp. ORS 3359]|nr:hypothetical protein MPLA_1320010 [Mesorhizobium sp. ORS 3359]